MVNFDMNTHQSGEPHVVGLTNGDFVVGWQAGGACAPQHHGSPLRRTGAPPAAAFTVTTPSGDNSLPRVAKLANGEFIFAWQSSTADGAGAGILARGFNAQGTAKAAQFVVRQ